MTSSRSRNAEKGRLAEDSACRFLEAHGWIIVDRNWRVRSGELDIMAVSGDELAFVEVKSVGAWGAESAEWLVDRRKRRRIIETAQFFLSRHREYNSMRIRFDVILVGADGSCEHLERAFGELP